MLAACDIGARSMEMLTLGLLLEYHGAPGVPVLPTRM